ncbi:MAG: alcohol dehydrogenase catalytic domain-containing protein [Myxococcota bacterium]|nr:alcohol dehydrogenase catalytic domain-containing protein [Myxococcota bacterium]MEC8424891.1 alcohol dehydrogenase catalytic domain-containing protein [Myxococcota bacterium]
MRALCLGPDGPFIDTAFRPVSRAGEARLSLRLGGVCATDLELVRGYMGFQGVLGHEFVAEVLDCPDPDLVGRRVVGRINVPCGTCPTCVSGRPTHCPSRTVLGIVGRDGAFSEEFWLPVDNLHTVPASVPDEAAVFVEPLAAACRIVEQVHVKPSDRVVVLGLGRLGQLCARVLALTGADVSGTARSPEKLALLPPGITPVHAAEADGLAGADIVVDCTGSPAGLETATRLVRPGGTLVMKTTVHELGAARPTAWVVDEVRLVGSRCGPFEPALRLLAAGLIDPTPLITARLPLEKGIQALARARAPGGMKVLLDPRA